MEGHHSPVCAQCDKVKKSISLFFPFYSFEQSLNTIHDSLQSYFVKIKPEDPSLGILCEIFRNVFIGFDPEETREETLGVCVELLKKGVNNEKIFSFLLEILKLSIARMTKGNSGGNPSDFLTKTIKFCLELLSWNFEEDLKNSHLVFTTDIMVKLLRIFPNEVYVNCSKEFTEELVLSYFSA